MRVLLIGTREIPIVAAIQIPVYVRTTPEAVDEADEMIKRMINEIKWIEERYERAARKNGERVIHR